MKNPIGKIIFVLLILSTPAFAQDSLFKGPTLAEQARDQQVMNRVLSRFERVGTHDEWMTVRSESEYGRLIYDSTISIGGMLAGLYEDIDEAQGSAILGGTNHDSVHIGDADLFQSIAPADDMAASDYWYRVPLKEAYRLSHIVESMLNELDDRWNALMAIRRQPTLVVLKRTLKE